MPTISSILSTATTGLRAQQSALNVVSHNIANAATEGYARQRAVLSPNPAIPLADGVFGSGVNVARVQQIRDALLDSNFRVETGDASEHQARAQMLTRVETVMGEPGEFGLAATLDRFFSAWSDLASNPTSAASRTVVRQRALELTERIGRLAADMEQIGQEAEARVAIGVSRVNELTDQIARFNQEIVSLEGNGDTAGDLRDARAKALDELATLIPVHVLERTNGAVGVTSSGIGIVDGAYSSPLDFRTSGGVAGLGITGRDGLLPEVGGSLGGLLEVVNTDLPGLKSMLDDLGAALVAEVNAVHGTGVNAAGNSGVAFFDPAGTTASTFSLSAAVRASASAIAAGTPDGDGDYRAGANDVALALAQLRDQPLGGLGSSAADQVRGLVSAVGLAVRSSTDAAQVHQTLADQAEVRRQSLSGVSVDEELVQLIQFQSAYQASARVISAADQMLQSLLAI